MQSEQSYNLDLQIRHANKSETSPSVTMDITRFDITNLYILPMLCFD